MLIKGVSQMRTRYKEEQIIQILREADETGSVQDVCRKYGVSQQTVYKWRQKYDGMQISEVRRTRLLEVENARLKRIVAEQALAIQAMQEVLRKKGVQ